MTCGERIKREREKRHLSQENLAEQMEVSRQAVSKWEADQSRPTREKLERLSALFELPMEVWTEEPPPPPEREQLKRWKMATAILSIALCATLIIGWISWPRVADNVEETVTTEPVSENPLPPDTSYIFPELLSLEDRSVDGFGNWPLEEVDAETVSESAQISGQAEVVFQDQFPRSSWLQMLRANPVNENHTTFYEVSAQYFKHITDPEPEIIPLGRLTDYNHYVGDGLNGAEYFTNVLGHDGWKITLVEGAACVTSWYFCVNADDGTVYPMLSASGSGTPYEYDVDEDGQKEVITSYGLPMGWFIYDTLPNGECVSYELNQNAYKATPISFSTEEGFVVSDDSGAVMAHYILQDGALLRRQPLEFSVRDYPDGAEVKLSFVTDPGMSDGRDPDEVLDNGTIRTTHRQQAMLAMQILYDVTGLKMTECFCAAFAGGLAFYTVEDGEPGTLFYDVTLGKQFGGDGWVSGITIYWQEEEPASPISFVSAKHQDGSGTMPERWLQNYANDLSLLCQGEIINMTKDPDERYENDRYVLCRADGTYYSARLLDTETGFALGHFYGPYPAKVA